MASTPIGRARSSIADIRTISYCFILYKGLLFLIALLTPGVGYDTSTSLLSGDSFFQSPRQYGGVTAPLSKRLSISPLKLARWDAIYFVEAARRGGGYVFEQEWAFSRVFSYIIGWIARVVVGDQWDDASPSDQFRCVTVVAVVVSHCAHYASAVVLYFLTRAVFEKKCKTSSSSSSSSTSLPLLSSLLHTITPGGAFLSAPNSEALFSLLNFSGFYAYISALRREEESEEEKEKEKPHHSHLSRDVLLLAAGLLFASATLIRSNGFLSGCLFAYDFACELWTCCSSIMAGTGLGLTGVKLRRMLVLIVGGSCIALAFALPQVIAFREYCQDAAHYSRPWCYRSVPAIYGFVQEKYWNVGFLRYWKLQNLPLFLLAGPMLAILLASSLAYIKPHLTTPSRDSQARHTTTTGSSSPSSLSSSSATSKAAYSYLFRLSLPQLLLSAAAITNYHVQIINRISSGYPVWYWFIAALMTVDQSVVASDSHEQDKKKKKKGKITHVVIRSMVAYSLIQGVLYANFLPPA